MKFNEKLINLRKEKGMSQEELGDRLGVTRQTISKWELGQATPNMTNLNELATLFNVDVNYLVDDNCDTYNKKQFKGGFKMDNNKKKKIIIIAAIVLGVIVVGALIRLALVNIVFNSAFDKVNDAQESGTQAVLDMFDKGIDYINDKADEIDSMENNSNNESANTNVNTSNISTEYELSSFNMALELYAGLQNDTFTKKALSAISLSNSKYADHQISVEFDGTTYTSASDILDLTNKIEQDKTYTILFNYDDSGYINKAIIK